IAYYGGAPPRPSPAPAPTPAPAPSVPHLPAPNPRRPFNGVSGDTSNQQGQTGGQRASQGRMGMGAWLWNDFFPTHEAQFAGLVVDALSIIAGPVVKLFSSKIANAAVEFFFSVASGAISGGGLAGALFNGNDQGIIGGVFSSLGQVFNIFWSSLNFWDQLEFGVGSVAVTAFGDAATAGTYTGYVATLGFAMLGVDAVTLSYDVYTSWQSYQSK
ncbi:MAG: hypothetical protein ACRECH_13225, partial [Nitrososphaerales archaeon]